MATTGWIDNPSVEVFEGLRDLPCLIDWEAPEEDAGFAIDCVEEGGHLVIQSDLTSAETTLLAAYDSRNRTSVKNSVLQGCHIAWTINPHSWARNLPWPDDLVSRSLWHSYVTHLHTYLTDPPGGPGQRLSRWANLYLGDTSRVVPVLATAAAVQITNEREVRGLLGPVGLRLLWRLLRLVGDIAGEMMWPLDRVVVSGERDLELPDWEHVRLLLVFATTFDVADHCLRELYPHIDRLAAPLPDEEGELLRRLIVLDVEATDL
jgi:hypothetical protein